MQKAFFSCLILLISHAGLASSPALGNVDDVTPPNVLVGVFPVALYGFDYEKNQFNVSFHIWWLTKDKDYQPEKMIELLNSNSYNEKHAHRDEIHGIYRTQARYMATVSHNWDMTNFPFDRHQLKVFIEDGLDERDKVLFVPDTNNTRVSLLVKNNLSGWKLDKFSLTEEPHVYQTNFGHPDFPQSNFSRLVLTFEIKRVGVGEFFTYFLGFFISVFLSGLAYFIHSSQIDSKLSLVMASVFGVVGSKYIVDTALPIMPNFTLTDSIQLASFIYIIIGSVIITIESTLVESNRLALNRVLNLATVTITSTAYLLYVGYNFWRAYKN